MVFGARKWFCCLAVSLALQPQGIKNYSWRQSTQFSVHDRGSVLSVSARI